MPTHIEKLKERRRQNCANFVIATSILGAVIAVAAIIMAAITIGYATRNATSQTYVASGVVVASPFYHFFGKFRRN